MWISPARKRCYPRTIPFILISPQARVFEILSPRASGTYRPLIQYQTLNSGYPVSSATSTAAPPSPISPRSASDFSDQILTIEEATPQKNLLLHPESELKCNADVGVTACFLKRLHTHYDHEAAAKDESARLLHIMLHKKKIELPAPAPQKGFFTQVRELGAREWRSKMRTWDAVAMRFLVSTLQIAFQGMAYLSCGRDLVAGEKPDQGGNRVEIKTEADFVGQITQVRIKTEDHFVGQ